MPIVIKKRVSLDFLGEDYKQAYLVFRSIPSVDFEELIPKMKEMEKNPDNSISFVLDLLTKYFISGEFPDEKGDLAEVVIDDLGQLDTTGLTRCFQLFTGAEIDPKVDTPSTNTSPMEEVSPTS